MLGILMLHIELFHVRGNAMGVGRLGILMLHIELLHVSCAQIWWRPGEVGPGLVVDGSSSRE